MAASSLRTPTAARKAEASAPARADRAPGKRDGIGTQGPADRAFSSLRQRLPEWFSSLEGPRKLAINGLVVAASLLGSAVVVTDALKQVAIIDTISVPKDLEADGYTGATMAQRLIDAVTRISRDAAVTRRSASMAWRVSISLKPVEAVVRRPSASARSRFRDSLTT